MEFGWRPFNGAGPFCNEGENLGSLEVISEDSVSLVSYSSLNSGPLLQLGWPVEGPAAGGSAPSALKRLWAMMGFPSLPASPASQVLKIGLGGLRDLRLLST